MHVKKLYTHQFHLANNFNGSPQDFFLCNKEEWDTFLFTFSIK